MWQKIKNYYHLAQAFLWATFFGFPSRKLKIIGVTGTDGKTTTVNMVYHILKSAGKKVSMVSSVNAVIGEKTYETGFHVSTPSPFDVQKYLKKALNSGSEYFVLETTSHGLDQNRLAFVDFEVGLLTNITHEHLDYHKTRENYVQAKLKLLKNSQKTILNKDDESFGYIQNKLSGNITTYSQKADSDFNLKNTPISLNVPGNYNLSNALAAVAASTSVGIDKIQAQKALKFFPGVKGRMEEIKTMQDFNIYVDFAHTPNGLKNALSTLRAKRGHGRLIAVFGAAGQRDKSKRPFMGEIADNLADIVILTSEDPRKENPKSICEQIKKGIVKKKFKKTLFVIVDRQEAINYAVKIAKPKDTIAVFGKGHETSMNIGGKEQHWSDFEAAERALGKTK